MKIHTTQSDLRDALANLADVVPTKSSMPILSCVRIESLADGSGVELTGTNCDMTVKTVLACKTEADSQSVAVVPYRTLAGVVNASEQGDISLVADNGFLRIDTPTGKSRMQMFATDLFPSSAKESSETKMTVNSAKMAKMLSQVEYAVAAKEEGRKVLENTLLSFKPECGKAVATNGRVLAESVVNDAGSKCDISIVVPKDATRLVRKILKSELGDSDDVELSVDKKKSYAEFRLSKTTVWTKLFDGLYPAYEKVLPDSSKEHQSICVSTTELISAVKRVCVFIDEMTGDRVILKFKDGFITVSLTNSTNGSSSEVVSTTGFSGDEKEVSFNPNLLVPALSSAFGEMVWIDIFKNLSPIRIRDDESYQAVVMPLALPNKQG